MDQEKEYGGKEEVKDILIENSKEYSKNAIKAENDGDYNTPVTLFFKALSALADLYILTKEKIVPSSHASRFRILEEKFQEIYKIMDKDFPFYQDSYKAKLNKEVSNMLKNDANKISQLLKINL